MIWVMTRSNRTSPTLERLFSDFDPAAWPVIAESNQGTLLHVRHEDLNLAVKLPRGRGLLHWARRLTLEREHRAYLRLQGLPGLPACHGLFQGRYLALQYIDGQPLRQTTGLQPPAFYQQLRASIDAMHARGVTHGDLKSRHNIMVSSEGHPVIIDLGTALLRKPGWRPLNRWLFNYLCQIDLNGWLKHKYGSYDQVSGTDRALLRRSLIERMNNWLRHRRGRGRTDSGS